MQKYIIVNIRHIQIQERHVPIAGLKNQFAEDPTMDKTFLYLACPYSHKDPGIRHDRFTRVTKAAGVLMEKGHVVYSPITHGHPIVLQHDLPTDFEFWSKLNHAFLKHSHTLLILMLEGWRESKGIQDEITIALNLQIKIKYRDEENVNE
jgi:hypothetical protein